MRPVRRHQTGFTLVELMVALVIGLFIIGAIFATYIGSSRSGRASAAMSQLTEDGATALMVLRQQIVLAGYSRPMRRSADGTRIERAWEDAALRGCDGAFADTGLADPFALSCADNASASDSLVLRYEADRNNTVPNVDSSVTPPSAVPVDCLGNSLTQQPGADGVAGTADDYYLADNRFEVVNASLRCRGNAGAVGAGAYPNAAQPLIDNVEDLQLRYGQISAESGADPRQIVRYISATEVGATAGAWATVQAVRICVLLRSVDEVLESAAPYHDCNQTVRTPNDRRLRRAFVSTVSLVNRN